MSECNVNQLSSDASCFTCLDQGTREGIQTELLCKILTAIGGGSESGSGEVAFSQVSVPTGQVAVPTSNLASRSKITIKALAANGDKVYVGLTGVSSTTGYELAAGQEIPLNVDDTVNLFAVSASGTQRVSILEE